MSSDPRSPRTPGLGEAVEQFTYATQQAPRAAGSTAAGAVGAGVGGLPDVRTGKDLEITVASGDKLDVRHFSIHERLSSLYTINLTVVSGNVDINFDDVVGKEATFTLHSGLTTRKWSGICNHIQQVRVEDGIGDRETLATYELSVVPALWLLTQRRNYRMFQQESELDIVKKLLKEWSIDFEEKLTETYKPRKYRVQYGESDFTFMCRMLEDVGVTFYFGNEGGETKLILADAPQSNTLRGRKLAYRDNPMDAPNEEHATRVRIGQRVRPGKYTMRDHDYRRPPSYKLMTTAEAKKEGVEGKLERYHYTPGAFLFRAEKGDDSPVADDRGKARTDEKEGEALAKKRLDAKRASAKVCSFDTNAHDLAPGTVLSMQDHPKSDLGPDKRLLVRESSMSGAHSDEWTHHCEVVSADAPFRPELMTPKPKVSGVESATVVGPAGEEIHCDEFGRVRVHFHWDRESQMDEKSSCWIHVSQPWGGTGFGGTNLPRIGQEVIVDFMGGDPDRPIIVGRVFTALQKTPYKLPDNKTQSGWQSRSSPAGGGDNYNEIMFEDKKGQELVRMQAEKDLKKLVKNDESVTIGNNRSKSVGANDSLTVGKNRTKRVAKNEQITIGLNQSVAVGVNRSTQVGAIDSTVVGDTHMVMVSPPGEGGGPATSATYKYEKIVFDTGTGATITMQGDSITLAATTINVTAKADLSASGKTTKVHGSSTADLTSDGPTTVSGVPVQLNGPGLFAGRVTELAPATITTGAALVVIGGASFPFPVEKLPDGSLKVGDHLIVKPGDANFPNFQNQTMRDLGIMASTPSGLQRLNNLQNNPGGHDITIRPMTQAEINKYGFNNSLAYRQGDGGLMSYDADGNPVPGSGSGTDIAYNPDVRLGPNGEPEPADAVLFHEMGHAEHNAYGTNRAGEHMDHGWDNREEWHTIEGGVNQPGSDINIPGVPQSPSENDYLEDRDYPYRRTDHNGGYENPDGTPITP